MSNAAQAFIAFLRCEAIQSEERARSLRATAAAIEANNLEGGRKKKRKRGDTAVKPKKAHSAYTLFVHENYELIKNSQPADAPSKDVISIVAKQWANTTEEEKNVWKARAEQMKDQLFMDEEEVGLSVPSPTTTAVGNNTNKRAAALAKKQSAKQQLQQQQQSSHLEEI